MFDLGHYLGSQQHQRASSTTSSTSLKLFDGSLPLPSLHIPPLPLQEIINTETTMSQNYSVPVLDPCNFVVPQTSSRRRRTLQSANQDTSEEILSSLTSSSYEDEAHEETPVGEATREVPSSLKRVDDIRETEFDEKVAVISHQTSEFKNDIATPALKRTSIHLYKPRIVSRADEFKDQEDCKSSEESLQTQQLSPSLN